MRLPTIPRDATPNRRIIVRASGGRIREPVDAKTRKKVMEQAKNKCQRKGCNESEILDIHHKDLDNENKKPSNLMVLCPTCHRKKHKESARKGIRREKGDLENTGFIY